MGKKTKKDGKRSKKTKTRKITITDKENTNKAPKGDKRDKKCVEKS